MHYIYYTYILYHNIIYIISISIFIFHYVFWYFVYRLRCMPYAPLYSLLHTGQIICSLLMAYLKLQLLIFQDCVTQHQETCFVPWYELTKQGFYFCGCLPLWRTGFNNSIISVLLAKSQWFHGWQITETLNFANTSLYGL